MESKIKDAEYAASNLKQTGENIFAYMSYARGLCANVDYDDTTLYQKAEAAKKAVNRLVKYINECIKKAQDQTALKF